MLAGIKSTVLLASIKSTELTGRHKKHSALLICPAGRLNSRIALRSPLAEQETDQTSVGLGLADGSPPALGGCALAGG